MSVSRVEERGNQKQDAMIESLSKHEYFEALRSFSNHPFNLGLMLKPFGIAMLCESSDGLLVGHILEELAESKSEEDTIEIFDVLDAAAGLGDEDSENMLEDANSKKVM